MVIFGLYYHAGQTIIGLGSFKSSDETEADPNFDVKGIENWLKLNSGKLDKVDPTIKAAWIKTIKNAGYSENDPLIQQINGEIDTNEYYQEQTNKAMEELDIADNDGGSDHIYQLPSKNGTSSSSSSLDDVMGDADSFINSGNNDKITASSLQSFSNTFYNILLTIGIVVAALVGMVIGIRFMVGGAAERANIKELLIPYVVGCIIVFGAFAIWKIVVTIMQQV